MPSTSTEHASPAVVVHQAGASGAHRPPGARRITSSRSSGRCIKLAAIMVAAAGDLRRVIVYIINLPRRFRTCGAPSAAASTDSGRRQNGRPEAAPCSARRISSSLCACGSVRGKPSRMNPSAQSGCAMRSSTMLRTMSSGTNSPRSMMGLALRPSGVPRPTCSRNMSPVERCGTPYRCAICWACVPLPAPGGPSRITARPRPWRPLALRALPDQP